MFDRQSAPVCACITPDHLISRWPSKTVGKIMKRIAKCVCYEVDNKNKLVSILTDVDIFSFKDKKKKKIDRYPKKSLH